MLDQGLIKTHSPNHAEAMTRRLPISEMLMQRTLPLLFALVSATGAVAAPPEDREAWLWASACMACHGTGGEATGVALRLKGLSADLMLEKLLAFKTGEVPSTVMRQHVSGYSDAELRRIARAFAALDSGKSR